MARSKGTLPERMMAGAGAAARDARAGAPPGPTAPAPRRLPEWEPFPLHWLPLPMAAVCREGADALGCDPAYLAMPALAAAAACIGNSRRLLLKRTWAAPPILWTVIVGESGTLKTPAHRLVMSPLYRMQRLWRDDFKSEGRAHDLAREEHREAVRAARREGRDPPEAPTRPTMRRLVASDITVEKLAVLLEENERGILVARDELAGWIASFTKYRSAGAGSDMANWLELYDGAPVLIDRKNAERPSVVVPNASVCLTGGIQPGTLARSVRDEHFDSGLIARLLMAWPPRRPKRWTEAELSEPCAARWARCLGAAQARGMVYVNGERQPVRLTLSPDARRAWVLWYDSWAGQQDLAEGEQAAAYSKIEGVAARLALVHHCMTMADIDSDDIREVGSASMDAGVGLARWFAAEAMRCYALARSGDDERRAASLAAWVAARGGAVTARDLHKANASRYPTPEAARDALDALRAAGAGGWRPCPPGPRGGRPTEAFHLAPEFLRRNPETGETPFEGDGRGDADDSGLAGETPFEGGGVP